MKIVAIDIGTSKICGMVIDDNATPLKIIKYANTSATSGKSINGSAEKEQNPDVILEICQKIYTELKKLYPDIKALGLTGQMHGIVYVDKNGKAVSHLYTWQDRQGTLIKENNLTYAEYLSKETGYRCVSGHGLTTHYYFACNKQVPPTACKICTIDAYVAMHLTGRNTPLMHKSDAESFDIFNIAKNSFDLDALKKVNISTDILPDVAKGEEIVGEMEDRTIVIIPIGDNQASVIGAMCKEDTPLVNLGTGGQISAITSQDVSLIKNVDVRPFINGKNLMVGASMCGGYAYTVLCRFFESTAKMLGINGTIDMFSIMGNEVKNHSKKDIIKAETTFLGAYDDPDKRGSYYNVSDANFTPANLIYATLHGMCNELFDIYNTKILPQVKVQPAKIVGSGNCVRSVPIVKNIIEEMFSLPLQINEQKEEAVYGAALLVLSKIKPSSNIL